MGDLKCCKIGLLVLSLHADSSRLLSCDVAMVGIKITGRKYGIAVEVGSFIIMSGQYLSEHENLTVKGVIYSD